MIDSLRDDIVELEDVLTRAAGSFAVWRELTDAATHENYLPILEAYESFCYATIEAHFLTIIVCSNSLFDSTKGTRTIPRLLDRLERANECKPFIASLRSRIQQIDPVRQKLEKLRHNVFAHRSVRGSPESWFGEVQISPDELRDFILESERILGHIALEAGMHFASEKVSATRDDTRALMAALGAPVA